MVLIGNPAQSILQFLFILFSQTLHQSVCIKSKDVSDHKYCV